jgi:arylsulfatase A-like enzyme
VYLKSILGYRPADEINKEAITIVSKKHTVPFFLFLNYMDTHVPYRPPPPYDNISLNKTFPQLYRLTQYFLRRNEKHDKSTWDAYLKSQYDGETAFLDHELGNFFAFLKDIGIYDSSLIIVTSDHGELLGEHGLYGHHAELYEGVAKVPLIIKFPYSKKTGRVKNIINLTDVFPTILSICDISIPQTISGQAYGGKSSPVSELYSYYIGEHKAIYVGKYKYMDYSYIEGQVNKEIKRPELYDLEKDPDEQENLAEKLPELVSAMRSELQNWKNRRTQIKTVPVDKSPVSEEIKEDLRALGYVQ